MNSPATRGLREGLAAARAPIDAVPMPRVGPRLTVRSSPLAHRLLPRRAAVVAAELRGGVQWRRRPDARESARAAMRLILAETARAEELETLARRHLIEREIHRALFWQPPRNASTDASSQAHLAGALQPGRGTLLSVCHLGPYFDVGTPLSARGLRYYSVAGPWFFENPTADAWGRRMAHWRRKMATRSSQRVIPSVGSFAVIQALLEAEEVVQCFFDMPGPRETRFLGKPVMLADGTARLALLTGALVVAIRAGRVGARVCVDVAAPLDARDYEDVEHLHSALAAIHERHILEQPEALEDPRRGGAWEEGAQAHAWVRPLPAKAIARTAPCV